MPPRRACSRAARRARARFRAAACQAPPIPPVSSSRPRRPSSTAGRSATTAVSWPGAPARHLRAGVQPHRVVGADGDPRAQLAPRPVSPMRSVRVGGHDRAGERLPRSAGSSAITSGSSSARWASYPACARSSRLQPRGRGDRAVAARLREAALVEVPARSEVNALAGRRPSGVGTRRPGSVRSSVDGPPHQIPGRLELRSSAPDSAATARSTARGYRRPAALLVRSIAGASTVVVEGRVGRRAGRRPLERVLGDRAPPAAPVDPGGRVDPAEQGGEVGVLQPRSARSPSASASSVGHGQQHGRAGVFGRARRGTSATGRAAAPTASTAYGAVGAAEPGRPAEQPQEAEAAPVRHEDLRRVGEPLPYVAAAVDGDGLGPTGRSRRCRRR